ncbi:MAG: spore coat associated protein CotJA [Firmicutes bacterium]|nr:spore coat associated protein CotJA [Bacillota bacterium]MBQ3199067.1 spore coat associated protein CotJA [Bacillota bacterium]
MQVWQDTYRPEAAFMHGTIFPELNLPYIIAGCPHMPGADKPGSGNWGANCKEGCKW